MSGPVILCLGPEGGGKTLLLKRLQTANVDSVTSTVETTGSNIVPILRRLPINLPPTSNKKGESSNQREKNQNTVQIPENKGWKSKDIVGVREMGGSLAPLWPSYYLQAKLIMYVLDSSNLFQISIATCLLMDLLPHELLKQAKFLIILAKKDLSELKKLNYLKFMLRLKDLQKQIGPGRFQVVETSSITGEGIEQVRQWIHKNLPRDQK